MLIGLGEAMTSFDFGFTRLKVKFTRVTFKKVHMVSAHYLENYLPIAFIFHMLIGLDRDMTLNDIGVSRSKVKVRRITFVK